MNARAANHDWPTRRPLAPTPSLHPLLPLLLACAEHTPSRPWDLDPTLDPETVVCHPGYEVAGVPSVLATRTRERPSSDHGSAHASARCTRGNIACADGAAFVTFEPPRFQFICPAEELSHEAERAWRTDTELTLRHELGHDAACLAYQERVREVVAGSTDCRVAGAARDALWAELDVVNKAYDRQEPRWRREQQAANPEAPR